MLSRKNINPETKKNYKKLILKKLALVLALLLSINTFFTITIHNKISFSDWKNTTTIIIASLAELAFLFYAAMNVPSVIRLYNALNVNDEKFYKICDEENI
ncbi:MAG: hypothetical protein QM802_20565 [Agriterribacter sp.]